MVFGLRRGDRPRKRSKSCASMDEEDPLLARSDDFTLHPRIWAFLGCVYIALGLTQAVLAGLWRWLLGAAFGLSLAKLGSTLVGLGVTGGRPQARLPPGASLGARARHCCGAIVLWGSTQFLRLFYRLRWPVVGYGAFVALLVAIHLSSPDPVVSSFPSSCGNNRLGCSRVARSAPQAPRGLEPSTVPSALEDVQAAVEGWVDRQAGARVLTSSPGFIHARCMTPFWGFADDLYVSLKCDEQGWTLVEAQGQLRVGKSDLGVNSRRLRRLFDWLDGAELPEGQCSGSGGSSRGGDTEKSN